MSSGNGEEKLNSIQQLEILRDEVNEIHRIRQSNSLAAVTITRRQHEANKLKSDLKKTTAYVKKLRSINTEGLQQCIRDSDSLNLSLYISEIVGALLETNFKATDVPSIALLSTCLHKKYEDFTLGIIPGLRTVLLNQPSDEDKDAGKKKRIQIRFALELFQLGVWTDESFLIELLAFILGKSKGLG